VPNVGCGSPQFFVNGLNSDLECSPVLHSKLKPTTLCRCVMADGIAEQPGEKIPETGCPANRDKASIAPLYQSFNST
jgi:hypothetical protein